MKKKILIGAGALVALIAAFLIIWFNFREKPIEGTKEVTIEVVDSKGKSTVYELKTDALYLKEAMDEAKGLKYSGTESEYGLMVEVVNDETAIFTQNGAYWSFYVNGEYCNYGIESQPVEDGDAFQIIYTKG